MATIASADGVFRLLAEEARDYSIVLMNGAGSIESWNSGAREIFGYERDEIIGRSFAVLFTESDRAAGVPEAELETARKLGRAADLRWHLRKDGTRIFIEGVTTLIRDDNGAFLGFAKVGRDVTGRRRAHDRLRAQLALTRLLSGDADVQLTARRVMQTICEHLDWDIGALWELDPERSRLRFIDEWHTDAISADLARFVSATATFERGRGIPGTVWEKGEALWITDFRDFQRFPRAALASQAGMQTALAFPIVHDQRFVGVMEFFSREHRAPDEELLSVMTLIGAQLGDYMDRRHTAQALRESEERYRLVSDTAQDAIFTIDVQSRIEFCNPAVERVFGYKPEEMIGKPLEMIIPERLREAHRRGIARFLQTGERRIPWTGVELPALHKDGHEFPAEISFGLWTDGSRTIFSGFARDISERKRVNEELRRLLTEAENVRGQLERRAEEESAFRHLASALAGAVEMNDVLYEITNRATHVTRADGVYVERILEPSRSVEVVATAGRGTPRRGLRIGFPGSLTEEILKKREPAILADVQSLGKSMTAYLADSCGRCEVLVTPLMADDQPEGALVLLNSRQSGRTFDEADIVRARTLGDLTSLALRRVRLMEREREAKEKAEAAVRIREETLGIVSHDLRNPLTRISLSADLLAASNPTDESELVQTIRTSARQMDRLINDLLDVAKLESGRMSVDCRAVDADEIVAYACESNRTVAEQKGQSIECDIEGPLPKIRADRDRLVQVFENLIGNAMKFTPPGGRIVLQAWSDEESVTFRVTDSGPGIPEPDLKNVFRAYWQAKKTAHMGAGLGLAIVRGIVEAHGGRVWAENTATGGAAFTFTVLRA